MAKGCGDVPASSTFVQLDGSMKKEHTTKGASHLVNTGNHLRWRNFQVGW